MQVKVSTKIQLRDRYNKLTENIVGAQCEPQSISTTFRNAEWKVTLKSFAGFSDLGCRELGLV